MIAALRGGEFRMSIRKFAIPLGPVPVIRIGDAAVDRSLTALFSPARNWPGPMVIWWPTNIPAFVKGTITDFPVASAALTAGPSSVDPSSLAAKSAALTELRKLGAAGPGTVWVGGGQVIPERISVVLGIGRGFSGGCRHGRQRAELGQKQAPAVYAVLRHAEFTIPGRESPINFRMPIFRISFHAEG